MKEIDDQDGTAAYLGVPPRTLEYWRYTKKGPPWTRVGRHVRYIKREVDGYLAGETIVPEAS